MCAIGDCGAITGHDGSADALVMRMNDHSDASECDVGFDERSRVIRTAIIDDVDAPHVGRNLRR